MPAPMPKRKHTLPTITVPPDGKAAKAVDVAKRKPWTVLGIIAAIPVVLMLAFTFKSNFFFIDFHISISSIHDSDLFLTSRQS